MDNKQIEMELRSEFYSLIFKRVLNSIDRPTIAYLINETTKRGHYIGYEYLNLTGWENIQIEMKPKDKASKLFSNWIKGTVNPSSISLINSLIIVVVENGNYSVLRDGISNILNNDKYKNISAYVCKDLIEINLPCGDKKEYIILKEFLYFLKNCVSYTQISYEKYNNIPNSEDIKVETDEDKRDAEAIERNVSKKKPAIYLGVGVLIILLLTIALGKFLKETNHDNASNTVISQQNIKNSVDVIPTRSEQTNIIPTTVITSKPEQTNIIPTIAVTPESTTNVISTSSPKAAVLTVNNPLNGIHLSGTINIRWSHNLPDNILKTVEAPYTCLQIYSSADNWVKPIDDQYWDYLNTSYNTTLQPGSYTLLIVVYDIRGNILSKGSSAFYVDDNGGIPKPSELKITYPGNNTGVPVGSINFTWNTDSQNVQRTCLQIFDHNNNYRLIQQEDWNGFKPSYSNTLEAGKYGLLVATYDKNNNILSQGEAVFYVEPTPLLEPVMLTITNPLYSEKVPEGTVNIIWNHNMSKEYAAIASRTCLQIFDHNNNYKLIEEKGFDGFKTSYSTQLKVGKYGVLVVIYDRNNHELSKGDLMFYIVKK